ncbi:Histone chaperone [Hortaea werneckii]|nr:Histone chaperone [Hortaea werneckii]KAI7098650.1 Histone chaperone [Hortaea werneckii]KAI7240718.1 Histone chaperone [Hortaea werneckii]KAI7324623.1 Histone chaperone [Hortaea werneckii]KAI7404079.1 Histone chaperone [Hortaea werneckii]
MATVSLLNVTVRNNPAPFNAPYEFEITFECLEPLQKDLEWKLTYVGSATSSEHDQELDSLLVGPIPVGVNKFIFEADPPNTTRIPATEILGVTVILLTCSYDDREFVRVGYYVNNEYEDETLANEPPAKPVLEKIRRSILAEKPRVTRFAIKWDSEESAPAEFPPEQPDVDQAEDDEARYGAEDDGEDEEGEAPELVEGGIGEAAKAKAPQGEDAEMEGVENGDGKEEDDEESSDAGSEDIENESSDDDEEDLEEDEAEEGAEGEASGQHGDHDMDMGDDHPADQKAGMQQQPQQHHQQQQQQPDVMVH